MKKLFAIELFSAQTVTFMRSNGILMFMALGFFAYITPSSGLAMSKFILRGNAEVFSILIEYALISKEKITIVSVAMGILLSIIIEISGFVFAVRGMHAWGLFFSITSSFASFSKFIYTFHYSDQGAFVDGFLAVFSSFAPVVIIYIIATEFEKFSHKGENPLTVYTEEASKKVNQGISENIKTFSVN